MKSMGDNTVAGKVVVPGLGQTWDYKRKMESGYVRNVGSN